VTFEAHKNDKKVYLTKIVFVVKQTTKPTNYCGKIIQKI